MLQRVLYFPLKPRLTKLLRNTHYREMLEHEFRRPSNNELLCDIYDAPAYKDLMGPVTSPNDRIALQYCIDSFPTNAEGSKSTKPGGMMNISLPPAQRAKPENMLMVIVIPTKIKDVGQKKYYDFMSYYELQDLSVNGVEGVRVKIFSASMDTPGRAELMGKQCLFYYYFVELFLFRCHRCVFFYFIVCFVICLQAFKTV